MWHQPHHKCSRAERIFAKFPAKLTQFREKGAVLVGDVHPGVSEVAGAITPCRRSRPDDHRHADEQYGEGAACGARTRLQ